MKKLLAILFVLSLTFTCWSCGDDDEPQKFVWNGDWNDPADPNYKPEGYNPIQGLWRKEGADTGLYFSDDFDAYKVEFFSDGSNKKSLWRESYIINDKAFSLRPPSGEIWRYSIEGDKLHITYELNNNNWLNYVRVE